MAPNMYRGAAAFGRFPFGGILPLIIGIALVALVVFLFIRNKKLKKQFGVPTGINVPQSVNAPESILKERLAKGEINEDEYDKLLVKLTK